MSCANTSSNPPPSLPATHSLPSLFHCFNPRVAFLQCYKVSCIHIIDSVPALTVFLHWQCFCIDCFSALTVFLHWLLLLHSQSPSWQLPSPRWPGRYMHLWHASSSVLHQNTQSSTILLLHLCHITLIIITTTVIMCVNIILSLPFSLDTSCCIIIITTMFYICPRALLPTDLVSEHIAISRNN